MAIGRIDWFGGFNKKKGKENNYGFIIPIDEDNAEGIYVNKQDVPLELHTHLKPGIYVHFEIITDDWGKKRAVDVELISLNEAIKFFLDKASKLTNWEKRVLANSLVNEADDLLLVSSELRKLIISDSNHTLSYCQFLNKYIYSADKSINQELLNELLEQLKKADDSLRSKYWNQIDFLKDNLEYRVNFWEVAPKTIKLGLIVNHAITLPVNEAIKFIRDKTATFSYLDKENIANILMNEASDLLLASSASELRQLFIGSIHQISAYCQFLSKHIDSTNKLNIQELLNELIAKINTLSYEKKRLLADSLISKADNLLLFSSELRQLLIFDSNQISTYCQLLNKYIDSADKSINQELLNEFLAQLKKADDSLRSKYWNQIDFLKDNSEYKGKFWHFTPQERKIDLIKNRYKKFFEIVSQFDQSEYPFSKALSFSWKELYKFDELDNNLVKKWCSDQPKNTFLLAQMKSARGAEKLVLRFYQDLEYSVEDTSIHQVNQKTDTWKQGDVMLDSEILLDVKNARKSLNSDTYSEFCIPKFKQNRGKEVLITAVLSPYLREEFMNGKEHPNFHVCDPIVLGEFNKTQLKDLENSFEDKFISINITRNSNPNTYLPHWLFDYNDKFYVEQSKIIDRFLQLKDSDIPDWEDILTVNAEIRLFPLFIASKRSLPEKWVDCLPNWKVDFMKFLINLPVKRITLPYLFLSLLRHFLLMLFDDNSNYSPQQYQEILYTNYAPNNPFNNPLKIHDPLNTIEYFCDTLQTLWDNRNSTRLTNFKIFKFNGKGLLQGQKSQDDQLRTILAYCGGWVEKKGKCGYTPLVIGKHENCPICGRLICPKCKYCSDDCKSIL
jgi:cold shock CspA family protein